MEAAVAPEPEVQLSERTQAQCAACQRPIRGPFYEVNHQVLCPACRQTVDRQLEGDSRTSRLLAAGGLGLLAMLAGTAGWVMVERLTGAHWGIVAAGIGVLVGRAVRRGSRARGGWRYQALAAFLTYASVSLAYLASPFWDLAMERGAEALGAATAQGVALALLQSLTLPVHAATSRPIGLLILLFGLREAWRVNGRSEVRIRGPFQLAPASAEPLDSDAPEAPGADPKQRSA